MSGNRIGHARGLLLATAASVFVLAVGCGGTSEPKAAQANQPAAAAKVAATAASGSSASPGSSASTAGTADAALIAKGQELFRTAGGVGCHLCHGPEARGDGVAGNGAPNIRGADKSKIRGALQGGVPLMQFIKLSEAELEAVSAYVASLGGR